MLCDIYLLVGLLPKKNLLVHFSFPAPAPLMLSLFFQLPERAETVRNDQTSAARGEPFTLAVRERLRRKHASLSEKVFGSPAVAIV